MVCRKYILFDLNVSVVEGFSAVDILKVDLQC